jgi:hypothetical protein
MDSVAGLNRELERVDEPELRSATRFNLCNVRVRIHYKYSSRFASRSSSPTPRPCDDFERLGIFKIFKIFIFAPTTR